MPHPLSWTETIPSPAALLPLMRIRPPLGVNLMALSIRLPKICGRSSGSARTARPTRGRVDPDPDAAALGRGDEGRDRAPEEIGERDGSQSGPAGRGIRGAEVQKPVHELGHADRVVFDEAQQGLPLPAAHPLTKGFRRAADDGEGRAQLVNDLAHEMRVLLVAGPAGRRLHARRGVAQRPDIARASLPHQERRAHVDREDRPVLAAAVRQAQAVRRTALVLGPADGLRGDDEVLDAELSQVGRSSIQRGAAPPRWLLMTSPILGSWTKIESSASEKKRRRGSAPRSPSAGRRRGRRRTGAPRISERRRSGRVPSDGTARVRRRRSRSGPRSDRSGREDRMIGAELALARVLAHRRQRVPADDQVEAREGRIQEGIGADETARLPEDGAHLDLLGFLDEEPVERVLREIAAGVEGIPPDAGPAEGVLVGIRGKDP